MICQTLNHFTCDVPLSTYHLVKQVLFLPHLYIGKIGLGEVYYSPNLSQLVSN